ncbi:sigma-70 family RNA polymerase sigma factor [Mucilaginibacter phyllosphaerae]
MYALPLYDACTDQELLALLTGGDERAFATIYDRYWKMLIGLAFNHTKNKFAAEEIVQEVFLSLWKRKSELAINCLNAYLATAIKFSVFKQLQQDKRQSRLINLNYAVTGNDLLEDKINAKFLQEYIDGLVEQLPEKCRLVYNYSRKEGLKNAEIAERLNVGEKAIEAHMTKALKVLRLNLKEIGILLCIAVEKII